MDRCCEEKEKKTEGRFYDMKDRFDKMERVMDRRFDEEEGKMRERFNCVNCCLDEQECSFRDFRVQIENATVITIKCRLRRFHPINLIKVQILHDAEYSKTFEWASHPEGPKHMASTYILG